MDADDAWLAISGGAGMQAMADGGRSTIFSKVAGRKWRVPLNTSTHSRNFPLAYHEPEQSCIHITNKPGTNNVYEKISQKSCGNEDPIS